MSEDENGLTVGAAGFIHGSIEVFFAANLHAFGVGTNERLTGINAANIRVENDVGKKLWNASPESMEGMEAAIEAIPGGWSQVDTMTIEGGHAWRTATFIDRIAVQKAWSEHGALPAPRSRVRHVRHPMRRVDATTKVARGTRSQSCQLQC